MYWILTVVLFAATGLFAAETCGLRVVVKDPVSGQQKEVKLYKKSYAVIIGIDQYHRKLLYGGNDFEKMIKGVYG